MHLLAQQAATLDNILWLSEMYWKAQWPHRCPAIVQVVTLSPSPAECRCCSLSCGCCPECVDLRRALCSPSEHH